ncbi:acetylglutamate kinase [bacterium]|nr:MAG: acetylglutamate kinase [bacterium]
MQQSFVVIKLSGSVLEQDELMSQLPVFVNQYIKNGFTPIIVHGAGKQVDLACSERNIPVQKIKGRRITSAEIRDIMLELVHGNLNRRITGLLLANNISALGVTTGDAQLLTFTKRPPKSFDGEMIDFGFVGDLSTIDSDKLKKLAEFTIPVFSCLGYSAVDGFLNVNADTITSAVALAVDAKIVVMISELAGVKNESGTFVSSLSLKEIESGIKNSWITDGMIVKLEQAMDLAKAGIIVQIGTLNGIINHTFTEIKA